MYTFILDKFFGNWRFKSIARVVCVELSIIDVFWNPIIVSLLSLFVWFILNYACPETCEKKKGKKEEAWFYWVCMFTL